MNRSVFSRLRHRGITRCLGALLTLLLIVPWSVVQALQLDGMSYANALAARSHIVPFVPGPRFFRLSGGVAFTKTATGKDGWQLSGMSYDQGAADGQRLLASFTKGARTVKTNTGLFDWEIAPLLKFVAQDTKNQGMSAVTLFGELKDPVADERVRSHGNMIINFHPAFENTLMGLRLLQADLLLIDLRAAALFQEQNVNIMGAGERPPAPDAIARNRERLRAVRSWMDENHVDFSSYVAGDLNSPVEFAVENGHLTFTGMPTWVVWSDPDRNQQAREDVARQMVAKALAVLPLEKAELAIALDYQWRWEYFDELKKAGLSSAVLQTRYAQAANVLVGELGALYKSHPGGKARLDANGQFRPDPAATDALIADLRGRVSRLSKEQRSELSKVMENSVSHAGLLRRTVNLPVDVDAKASSELSAKIQELDGINPVVYRTLTRAMHHVALLRHYRNVDPTGFRALANATQKIDASPLQPAGWVVQTPTVYPRGRDTR